MAQPHWILNRAEMARLNRQVKRDGDCWLWTGPTTPNGYGKVRVRGGEPERVVHRVLWEAHNNMAVPDGYQLDHLCRTRLCCNPAHLEPVTASENTLRQDHANRRKDTCPAGHAYTEENTLVWADGKRRCRACRDERRANA